MTGRLAAAREAIRQRLAGAQSTALLVRRAGRDLIVVGDVAAPSYVASVRKSILALLYGPHVSAGRIDLDATLADLGIVDREPLSDLERTATVRDLLTSRSGVYHPAASPGGDVPLARGSHRPGTHFVYNNWDFNTLEEIFRLRTGCTVHEAFEQQLARPLGLADHDPAAHRPLGVPQRSRHLAHHHFLSARELARLGELVLHDGVHEGRSLVPAAWLAAVLQPHVLADAIGMPSFGDAALDYGYLWWLPRRPPGHPWAGAALAAGNYGQYLLCLPALDTVVVYRVRVSDAFAIARNTGGDIATEETTGLAVHDFLTLAEDILDALS
ncbi:serine hydrolase domain-containing protein [Dactylosporangium sp. CA-233914]|uniref:serine hydrolase domain-containing protein n=1 Tax=Dactylosporangium sp. CA-233914 TaxID=3239934 RepID=UPI003D8E604C